MEGGYAEKRGGGGGKFMTASEQGEEEQEEEIMPTGCLYCEGGKGGPWDKKDPFA